MEGGGEGKAGGKRAWENERVGSQGQRGKGRKREGGGRGRRQERGRMGEREREGEDGGE